VALEKLTPFISKESPVLVKAIGPMLYLRSPDFLREVGVDSKAGSVPVTLEDRSGRRHTITLEPAPMRSLVRRLMPSRLPGAPAAPFYLRDVEKNYWFEHLPKHRAVYFQFNPLRESAGEPLAAFSTRLQRFLDEHEVQNLIVDTRHNFGGDTNLIPLVLRTLIRFETSRPDARLYVLTSRTTFSAGQSFVSQVYRWTRAVFARRTEQLQTEFRWRRHRGTASIQRHVPQHLVSVPSIESSRQPRLDLAGDPGCINVGGLLRESGSCSRSGAAGHRAETKSIRSAARHVTAVRSIR
jgi:hypothetical protein